MPARIAARAVNTPRDILAPFLLTVQPLCGLEYQVLDVAAGCSCSGVLASNTAYSSDRLPCRAEVAKSFSLDSGALEVLNR